MSSLGEPGGPPGCVTTADGPSHTTSSNWRSSMSTMIAQPGRPAHPEPHPDKAARQRQERLARASVEEMESALAFLSMIDPEAFEIAFTAVARRVTEVTKVTDVTKVTGVTEDAEAPEDEEPIPVCRECSAPVGIFLAHGLAWRHFRGDSATAGTQEIYDPGHPAEAAWLLPGEDPEDL
jgi:hypothetical protein